MIVCQAFKRRRNSLLIQAKDNCIENMPIKNQQKQNNTKHNKTKQQQQNETKNKNKKETCHIWVYYFKPFKMHPSL